MKTFCILTISQELYSEAFYSKFSVHWKGESGKILVKILFYREYL